jgi:hypothetical protein
MAPEMIDHERRRTAAAAALFLALTLIATYPLARAPASYAFFGHADAQLNMWILAWDAHAVARDPRHLFDANIFAPERRTLAYSETLLGYLPIAGPILWLGGTPALAFNAVLGFSFVASGLLMYLLARRLTGHHGAAILGGVVYAFLPYRFAHMPQIQLESMEWMPLAFLYLHLFIERRRLRYAAAVGATVVIQAFCCLYYSVFLGLALIVAAPILLLGHHGRTRGATLLTLALVGSITLVALSPLGAEYMRVHREQRLERTLDETAARAADRSAFVASPARLHQRLWARSDGAPRDYLFPGVIALLLCAIAIGGSVKALPSAFRRPPTPVLTPALTPSLTAAPRQPLSFGPLVLAYGAVALVGVLASLGPHGVGGVSLFRVLYAAGPLMHGLRQVSRFAVLGLFGVSVLAAIGAALVTANARGFGTLASAILAALAFTEVLVAPITADRPGGEALVPVPPAPPVYGWLARQPGTFSIVELPFAPRGQMWQNGPYVYWSTVHWHGIVDAYSGFAPPSYAEFARTLSRFPDDRSHEALTARHVRYVIVHFDLYKPWNSPLNVARVNRTTWLHEVERFPDVVVLAVEPDERMLTRVDDRR